MAVGRAAAALTQEGGRRTGGPLPWTRPRPGRPT